jgi:molecular chaperone HtpG
LIRALADGVRRHGAAGGIDDFALALFDQALILEGEPPPDAAAFARRLTRFMEQGLKSG